MSDQKTMIEINPNINDEKEVGKVSLSSRIYSDLIMLLVKITKKICNAYIWFKHEKIYHISVLLLGVGCLFVYYFAESVGLASESTSEHMVLFLHLVFDILKEVGVALIIAFILISTIERMTRERHAKDNKALLDTLGEKLLEVVYKKNVPEKLFDEVMSELVRSDVIRKNHRMSFTLEKWQTDDPDLKDQYITIHSMDSATIENVNLAAPEITYHAKLSLDVKADARLNSLSKIINIKIGDRDLSPKEIQDSSNSDTHQNFLSFDYPLTIKSGESIQIAFEWSSVKRIEDSEVMILVLPADGVEISLVTPGRDLQVVAYAMHGKELEPSNLNDDVVHKWSLNYGIYPNQGVYFNWWPIT